MGISVRLDGARKLIEALLELAISSFERFCSGPESSEEFSSEPDESELLKFSLILEDKLSYASSILSMENLPACLPREEE